jgi:hypothetical protein
MSAAATTLGNGCLPAPLPRVTFFHLNCLGPELVFINVLAQGKRLVQNRSFCESTLKGVSHEIFRVLF